MKIPFNNLYELNKSFKDKFLKDVENIFENSDFVGGKFVESFEEKFSNFTGNKHAVATSSGSDSLSIIIRAYNLRPDDGVIYYPANTFIGSVLGALQLGFKCKPYDVNLQTFNAEKESYLQIGDDAIAVIAVHLYGYGLKSIEHLQKICKDKKILLFEDCSQSHFQTINKTQKQVSNFGDASFFSMYPGKNFGAAGQAGAICVNDKSISDRMKAIRNYGAPKKYEHSYKGFNHRMDSIQAAFLLRKFDVMQNEISRRRKIAKKYLENINVNSFTLMNVESDESVWHIFPIVADNRDSLIEHLTKRNIETVIHYPKNIHQFDTWQGQLIKSETKNADLLASKVLSIPCHGAMSDEETDYVIEAINDFRE